MKRGRNERREVEFKTGRRREKGDEVGRMNAKKEGGR